MTYNQFRRAIRAYYGCPVSRYWMGRLWSDWKAGKIADHYSLKAIAPPTP